MLQVERGRVTDEFLARLAAWSGKQRRPWTMGVSSHVVAALVAEVRAGRLSTRGGVGQPVGGYDGGMTNENADQQPAETREVSVEEPAKVTDTVEVTNTTETARSTGTPDPVTEGLEAEPKQNPDA